MQGWMPGKNLLAINAIPLVHWGLWMSEIGQKRTFAKTRQQAGYFLAMTLTATRPNRVKEEHWRESHLVAGKGRLTWHQYMESSS